MKKTIKRTANRQLVTEALGGKYRITITDIRNSPQSDCVFRPNGEFYGLKSVAPWTKDDMLNVDDDDNEEEYSVSTSNPDELFTWMSSIVDKLDQSDLFNLIDNVTLNKKFNPATMKIQVFRGRFPINIEYRPRISIPLGRGMTPFKPGFYAIHALNQALPLLRNGYNERAMEAIDQTNILYTDLQPAQFIETYVKSMERAGRVSIREGEKEDSQKEVDVITAKGPSKEDKAGKKEEKGEKKEEEEKKVNESAADTELPKAGDTCTSCGAVLGADEPGPMCADCNQKAENLDESLPPFDVFLSELDDHTEPWTDFATEEDYRNIVKTIARQLRDTCGKFALSAENYDDLLESIAYKVLIWMYNGEIA